MINRWAVIALGGAIGAVGRYAINIAVQSMMCTSFPIGTLLVNALGSFLMGVLSGYFSFHQPHLTNLSFFWCVGVLGAFTTFSSFSLETWNLLAGKMIGLAMINIIANLSLCLLFVSLGIGLIAYFY